MTLVGYVLEHVKQNHNEEHQQKVDHQRSSQLSATVVNHSGHDGVTMQSNSIELLMNEGLISMQERASSKKTVLSDPILRWLELASREAQTSV
eukprot:5005882-Amphidinium_carterae.1